VFIREIITSTTLVAVLSIEIFHMIIGCILACFGFNHEIFPKEMDGRRNRDFS
jgi:hypothetical protein